LPRFLLVDLPGYGYAKVSKEVRAQWAPLIEQYLSGRSRLHRVVLLIESRVVGHQDNETIAWLASIGLTPLIVATKVDKLKPSERVGALRQLRQNLGLPDGGAFMVFSSVTGEGRDRLWAALTEQTRT
jgi:GTP-binding protein